MSKTLSVHLGSWAPTPTQVRYQWLRNGRRISGSTGATYMLAGRDLGTTISVRVTGSRDAYEPATVTSDETAPITPPAPPTKD